MFLSIIIPCYNSGRFIGRCLEMLLRQGLDDCEVVVVNDGSNDDTRAVAGKYAAAHAAIRVIDQENRGVSVARNTGLEAARGEYVYFLDSDDALTDGSLDFFRQTVSGHPDCRFFAFGYETRRDGKTCKRYVYPRWDGRELSGRIFTQKFLEKSFCVHICSCIYERRYLLDNGLRFTPGVRIGEDVLFTLQALPGVERAYYSQRLTFVYQLRNDSAMRGYRSYSVEQYHSHALLREYLLPVARGERSMSNYIHFFLLFSYISNLRYYLMSDFKDKRLNKHFITDGSIRYKRNLTHNIPYWIAMQITILVPIRLILKILK